MTGLEKVTGKIIADAEADARATLAAAQADCEAADAAAAAKTEADCDGLRESAGREGESLIRRAKSAAEMARRDVLLETRSGLVEEAYRQAEKEIRDLPADKYAALLTGMLKAALRRQLRPLLEQRQTVRQLGITLFQQRHDLLQASHILFKRLFCRHVSPPYPPRRIAGCPAPAGRGCALPPPHRRHSSISYLPRSVPRHSPAPAPSAG